MEKNTLKRKYGKILLKNKRNGVESLVHNEPLKE
jgi:hypothetical protein